MKTSFASLFESDTLLTGPSFQSHLYADNNVLPNLSTESTFSSQDGLFVPFDQSWFSHAESDNAMSIDATPAVNSIDPTEGLNEVFNNADLGTSVAEELVCYGMVSTHLDLFLVIQEDLYLQMHSSTMRRSNLWDRAKSYREGYKKSRMAARTFPGVILSESDHQLNCSCSSNLPITGIWDISMRRWRAS